MSRSPVGADAAEAARRELSEDDVVEDDVVEVVSSSTAASPRPD
ncbi:hypothetical protein [Streptomyces sp. NPDC059272]